MNRMVMGLFLAGWVGAAGVSFGAAEVRHGETHAAPAELPDPAGLEDCLRYAALHNAGLEAAFDRWKAALERVSQADALPDPRFNYTYFIEEVETRVGPQRHKFGLAQTFPWFGKRRLAGDAAGEAAAAEQQEYEQARLALFYRVKAAYYEYWYLAQVIAVTRDHLKLVTNLEGVARARFTAGAAPNSAVIQAQVELGKLDDRLRSMEAMRAPLAARLNAALARPTHLALPWPRSLPELGASFTDEEALQWLAESNPSLGRLDHLARKEAAGIGLAEKRYYPDVTLSIDYVETGEALNPDMADSG